MEIVRGLVAVLVLCAVLGGVPLALVALVGNPLPTTLPSRSWLDAELTASSLIDVLAVVLWLLWGHFVLCVVAELQAWVGGGVSGAVPLGGASQQVAQRLVAAVLLLAAGAVWVPDAATVVHVGRASVQTSVAEGHIANTGSPFQADSESGAARTGPVAGVPDAAWGSAVTPAPSGAGAVDTRAGSPVVYVVQPPLGRHHDCLWDIAERTLGDPLRYPEIFALNQDRVQADGSRLVDADLIRPGWTLLLPADAVGGSPALAPATLAAVPTSPVPISPVPISPAPTPSAQWPAAPSPAGNPASSHVLEQRPALMLQTQDAASTGDGDVFGRGALSAGLLAIGLAAATRTPSPGGVRAAAERGLDDPGRARFLDAALRHLAAGTHDSDAGLPALLAARLGAADLVLHLSELPADPPPAPFTVEGLTWQVRREALEAVEPFATPLGGRPPAPYPALTDVARLGADDLLVDLEAAPGLVSLGGDEVTARGLALSMAAELALNPWSDGVHVHLVGFAASHAHLAPEFVEDVASLTDLMERMESAAHEPGRDA
ncbi:MAG: hypothetical protein ACRYF3_15535, partial [Janthinobacterium lividum]